MDEQEFKARYINQSGITEDLFDDNFVVLPCNCGDELCQGWSVVSKSMFKANDGLDDKQ